MTSYLRLPTPFPSCWLLLIVSLLANGEAHAVAEEDSPSGVRIEEGRVDTTLAATEKQNALPVKIRVSLLLRNATDQRDTVRRVFPIAARLTKRVPRSKTA